MPFSSFGLHANLLRGVKDLGFAQPTPIQKDAIPAGLAGRDVLACSATGSGKTAAFVLPILQRLMVLPRGTTRTLILAPTRELAAQLQEHICELGQHTPITSAAIYGGVGMGPQRQALERGVDIIVATPGRLLDHFQYRYADMTGITMLVLDEADRMLDMGFLPDIRRILQRLPQERQTYFFSATLPHEIVTLAHEMLDQPVAINLQRQSQPASGITQNIYPVPHLRKSPLLLALVQSGSIRSALVFTRTKRRADRVAEYLKRNGIAAARIHGDRTQAQRTQAMEGFKRGRYQVLVATDVAARGIDVDALSHVINYDMPGSTDDYIHRVGRTARAEATGDAFTFVTPEEEHDLRAIEQGLARTLPRVVVPQFDYTVAESDARAAAARTSAHNGHRPSGGRQGQRHSESGGNGERRSSRSGSSRAWEQPAWESRHATRHAASRA
ncbi:MAG: DEAD/DEAH box helicase [Planctomycetota bacterium]|nr:DEAD/DEAH box helicase [Planctomycetota bacterium]